MPTPLVRPDLTVTTQLGTAITVGLTIADKTGTATDPSALACRLAKPDGTEDVAPTPVDEAGTGAWSVTVTPDEPGRWHLHVRATSPNAATVIALDVADPGVPAPY